MSEKKSLEEVMTDVSRDFIHLLMLPDAEGTPEEKAETLRFGAECVAIKFEHIGMATPESREAVAEGIAALITLLNEGDH